MRHISLLSLCLLLAVPAWAQDWPEVRPEARPGTRWWWLGSAVDEPNLTYNIKEYGEAGLGTLEITPIYGVKGNEKHNIDFLSPQWMRMLSHVYAEAGKQGIVTEMNMGTGWPFGGPEVTPDEAATKAVFEQYAVTGGKPVVLDIQIRDPKERKRQQGIAKMECLMAYCADGGRAAGRRMAACGAL